MLPLSLRARALPAALASALAMLGVAAPQASAGQYSVTPCVAGVAPFPGSGLLSGDGATTVTDGCVAGSGFRLSFANNRVFFGLGNGLRVRIPDAYPNARIIRLTGGMSFAARTGSYAAFGMRDETNGGYNSTAGTGPATGPDFPLAAGEVIIDRAFGQSPAGPTRSVIWRLESSDTTTFDSGLAGGADAVLNGMSVVLDDSTRPVAASFDRTGLLDGAPQAGKRILTVTVADEDSGTNSALVQRAGTAIGSVSGGCRYVSVEACPAKRTLDVVVDTTQLADGPHTLSVVTYDAANNQRTDVSPTFTVANAAASPTPPPGTGRPNGDPKGGAIVTFGAKAKTARKKPSKLSRRWGQKVTLSGRLLAADGTPMAGASLDITRTLATRGAAVERMATITTSATGAYRYTFKATASATVAVRYPQTVGASDWTAAAVAQLRTSAKVSLRRKGGAARRGSSMRFTGRVSAESIPGSGAKIAIQYHLRSGAWSNADIVTTRPDGSFTWTHRFRTAGAYRLRARVKKDARLPAEPGNSPELRFRIR